MSEVVKKLVTELGYKIVDQDKIKKYSNTAKDILKTQKETNKATEKGLTLKQKEKIAITEESKQKKANFKKEVQEKAKIQRQYEKDFKDLVRKEEKEKIKSELALIKKINKQKQGYEESVIANKKQMYSRMFDDISKKEKQTIQQLNDFKQRQEDKRIRGQERRDIIASNRAGAYDRRLNFGAGQRGSSFDTRMNDILARKGKMIDPNNPNRIINIPKQSSFTYPTTAEKQGAREDILQGGGAAVGVGSIALISKFIKESANLENELVRIKTFGDVTSAEGMNRIREAIKLATEVSVFSPTDIAKQGVEFGKAGLKETGAKKDLSSMMLANTKFARIADAAPDESAKTLLTMMKTFGVPAAKAGDMMDKIAYALNETMLDFDKLQYAVAYSASSFNNVGMTAEDLLGASGFLANRGLPASTIGTSLRSIVTSVSLLKSSFYKKISDKKDKAKIATKIKDLGIDEKQFMKGNALDALTMIGSSKKFKGMSKAEQQAIYFDLFGKPAMGAAIMLGSMAPEERKYFKNVKDPNVTKGYTDRTLKGLNVGTQYQMGQTQSKATLAMSSIGKQFNPDIEQMTNFINSISEMINKSGGLQRLTAELLKIGSLGGMLLGATAGIRLLGLALGLPVFAIGAPWILALTALTLGINDVWNAFAGRESYLLNFGNAIHNTVNSVVGSISNMDAVVNTHLKNIGQAFYNYMNPNVGIMNSMANALRNATAGIQEFLPGYQTLADLGIINVGVKVTNSGVPYAPGQTPSKPNYVLSSSANKSMASRKG